MITIEEEGLIPSRHNIIFTKFSDGCETCTLPFLKGGGTGCTINVNITDCQNDIFRIMLVKEALDSLGATDVHLNIKYMPNARADRRFDCGMPHPLKITASLINSCNFKEVIVFDPHSDVTEGVIDNLIIVPQYQLFRNFVDNLNNDFLLTDYTLCSPDLGATKKTFELVQSLGKDRFIQAIKVRDVKTGNIVKCDVVDDGPITDTVVIVDDISDGGASFTHLSKLLKERGAGKVILYVTHGIFSKGLAPLKGVIDEIWCYNVVCEYVTREDINNFNRNTGE